MTDEQYDALHAKLKALVEKWHAPLGLKWWSVRYVYCRGGIDDAKHPNAAALSTVSWQYLQATIQFDMPVIFEAEMDDERLEWLVLHEMMHILVNEMRWQDDDADNIDHEERVATTLAYAFRWTAEQFAKPEPVEA